MLRLHAKLATPLPIEVDGLTPDALHGLSLPDIARRPALVGRDTVPWEDLFDITGDAADHEILITGNSAGYKQIGRGMTAGRITVEGSVGLHAGAELRGGELIIRGNAGDWLGAEMRGGMIRVGGNAGNHAGAAYPGSPKGMRGGTILIAGNAGSEAGTAMRRGMIAIGGNAGAFAGAGMIAGTLMIGGECGPHPGAGMKRGTLAVLSGRVEIPRTFRYDCEYEPPFWALIVRHLRQLNHAMPAGIEHRPIRRYGGDLVSLGLGELIVPSERAFGPRV